MDIELIKAFIDPVTGSIALGLGLADSIMGTINRRSQARKQLRRLSSLEDEVNLAAEKQSRLAYDTYGNKITSLSESVGLNLSKTVKSANYTAGRSGFEFSGTAEDDKNLALDSIANQGEASRDSLTESLGQSLIGIEENRGSQLSDIDAQRRKLKAQKNEKFLGLF